uniref:Uncharacterized protein n=1 Tax=Anguilla anguilla TaxID=7936 RepID=A0A0E9TRH4_ANGAN
MDTPVPPLKSLPPTTTTLPHSPSGVIAVAGLTAGRGPMRSTKSRP